MMKKVAVIMGSDSDLPIVSGAIKKLRYFGVECIMHSIRFIMFLRELRYSVRMGLIPGSASVWLNMIRMEIK